jgi:hypothetical protein
MCNGKHSCFTKKVCKILLIIGGLNWGLVGVGMLMNSNWNVINLLLVSVPTLEAIIYILVGIAAVLKVFGCCCKCKDCVAGNASNVPNMDKSL